jgi:hypothetical protein
LGEILSLCEDAGPELGVQLIAVLYCLGEASEGIIEGSYLMDDTAVDCVGLFLDGDNIDGCRFRCMFSSVDG